MRDRVGPRDDRLVHVRQARQSDAARLAEVHVRSWQAAYAGLLPQAFLDDLDPAQRTSGWQTTLRAAHAPGQATLVAERGGQLVGFAHLCPARDTGDNTTGEIVAMYVTPGSWRSGVGRRLMAASLDHLVQAGFDRAILWVLSDNERAIRFYEATGWRADGASKSDTVGDVPVIEIRMTQLLS